MTDEHASSLQVAYSIPQGSIMDPLLFLCYLKGYPVVVTDGTGSGFLYADDSRLLVTEPKKSCTQ